MRETIKLVVTVMAYPAISVRHGETVCVAGIRTDLLMSNSWVRLFPFRVRNLSAATRIHKWDEISVEVSKSANDRRPESYTPNLDSLEILRHVGTHRGWQERRAIVDQLPLIPTMAVLDRQQAVDSTSLAVVPVGEVLDMEVSPRPRAEIDELSERARRATALGDLFSIGNPTEPLEPVPFNFHYVVRYPDETEPRRLKIIDWEINQAWRKWRHEYSDPEERVRDKWLHVLLEADSEPSFFVGNMHRFQDQFLILSVFWPPRR